VLVVDIGGTNVKILATGQAEPRKFSSGPTLTPKRMVAGVKKLAWDWKYDVISIGYPGPILGGRSVSEPFNLGPGWVGFNFQAAFGRPVKVINDGGRDGGCSFRSSLLSRSEKDRTRAATQARPADVVNVVPSGGLDRARSFLSTGFEGLVLTV
jgi:hypothetical protein